MRRALAAAAIAGIVIVTATAISTTRGRSDYRVAAVFDTAKGIVAGQQVKIAGAAVGRVERVELTAGPKARLVLSVPRRFAPFHADATCEILPEGLISENFVACDPGSPAARTLAEVRGLPTVPLRQTSVPASIQDVLNAFAAPTPDRLRILIGELGIGLAGRGEDLNALLRRSNPALIKTDRALEVVDRQRARLADAVTQTDRVVAALAARHQDVRRFVARAAAVAAVGARRSTDVAAAVRNLRPLLRAARPALRAVDRTVTQGTPLLAMLRASAPGLSTLTHRLPAFAAAGTRALPSLTAATDEGRTTIRASRKLTGDLQTSATRSVPFARRLDTLLRSTRNAGGIEGLLRYMYGLSSLIGTYDGVSHFANLMLRLEPGCNTVAPAPGCRVKYYEPGGGTISPDDPSCGPVPIEPWAPPTSCRARAPVPRREKTAPALKRPSRLPSSVRLPTVTGGPPAARHPSAVRHPSAAPAVKTAVDALLDYLLTP